MKFKLVFLTCLLITSLIFPATSQIKVNTKDSIINYVKNTLLGKGIAVNNVTFIGYKKSIGSFEADRKLLGIPKGLVLSTGLADSVGHPNQKSNYTSMAPYEKDELKNIKQIMRGDAELKKAAKSKIYDMAMLEFDFVPLNNKLQFKYVFASDEYPEFVGSKFNDVFCFFISEAGSKKSRNIALVEGTTTPITINNVNQLKNEQYFRKNYRSKRKLKRAIKAGNNDLVMLMKGCEFDGLTTVLIAHCDVIPYKVYHMKIAIADAGDGAYDSAVFLEGNSFMSVVDSSGTYFKNLKEIVGKKIPFNPDSLFNIKKPIIASSGKDTITNHEPKAKEKEVGHVIIYFDTNKSELKPSEKAKLDSIFDVKKLKDFSMIEIFGFTDARGSRDLNQKLAQDRNNAVQEYILPKGVKKEIIEHYESDFLKEADTNSTDSGRSHNRRVEITFYKTE